MHRFGSPRTKLRVFAAASSSLSPDQIGRNYRFFHVDGGHNTDEALGDLQLAAKCTVTRGAIMIDDPFRGEWPGVTEGTIRFLDGMPEYAAVAVGFNKLLISREEAAEIYAQSFEDKGTRREYGLGYPWSLKTLPFVSRPLRIFKIGSKVNQRSLRARVERLHRTKAWSRQPMPAHLISLARRFLP
jgi:hypothetical protein